MTTLICFLPFSSTTFCLYCIWLVLTTEQRYREDELVPSLISVLKDENKNIAKCKVIIDSITVWFLSLVERREDPFTLLIRFIGMMGIRVLDLFRIFESGANSIVTKENFIRGVKVILCFICAFLLLMLCIK
jgi:hypothetical protein